MKTKQGFIPPTKMNTGNDKQVCIPHTKVNIGNDKRGCIPPTKINAGNDKKQKKAPVTKIDPASKVKKLNIAASKQKFGNKEFKSTKTYNFFADLAKDVKLTTNKSISAQAAVSTESAKSTINDSKSGKANLPSNTPLQISSRETQPKTPPPGNKEQPEAEGEWNTVTKYREPRQLKPSRNNCGECEGCNTDINCLTCKFCLKPCLKKKCEKRLCHKKLKKNVPSNAYVDSGNIDSLSDNTPDVEPSNSRPPGQSVLTTKDRKVFKCLRCNQSFMFPKWLVNHMKKDNCGEGASVKMKQCPVCKKLIRQLYLKKHIKIHNVAMIKCDKCSGSFKTQETLQAHKISIHEPKPISDVVQKCDICGKIFKHESLLKQHISKYHTSKDIKCEDCEMVFGTKGGLRRHMKNHEAILILECDENMYI